MMKFIKQQRQVIRMTLELLEPYGARITMDPDGLTVTSDKKLPAYEAELLDGIVPMLHAVMKRHGINADDGPFTLAALIERLQWEGFDSSYTLPKLLTMNSTIQQRQTLRRLLSELKPYRPLMRLHGGRIQIATDTPLPDDLLAKVADMEQLLGAAMEFASEAKSGAPGEDQEGLQ